MLPIISPHFSMADGIPDADIVLAPTLLLLTHAPSHPSTAMGLDYAKLFVDKWQSDPIYQADAVDLSIFLYGEAAMLANRLIWLPADMPNLAKEWQQFAYDSGILHQVCVSTALARGVVDGDNAKRHGLKGENLAQGFHLVGLGELAMHLHRCTNVYQF